MATNKNIQTFRIEIDGYEPYFVAADTNDRLWSKSNAAEEAVRKLGITTSRFNPQDIEVVVATQTVVGGKVSYTGHSTCTVRPPLAEFTELEYERAVTDLLQGVPAEFRSFVSRTAYERGHSAGRSETLSIMTELVSDLSRPISSYYARIISEILQKTSKS